MKLKYLQKIGHEFVSGKSLNPRLHIIYWVPLPHSVINSNEINFIVASVYITRKISLQFDWARLGWAGLGYQSVL